MLAYFVFTCDAVPVTDTLFFTPGCSDVCKGVDRPVIASLSVYLRTHDRHIGVAVCVLRVNPCRVAIVVHLHGCSHAVMVRTLL